MIWKLDTGGNLALDLGTRNAQGNQRSLAADSPSTEMENTKGPDLMVSWDDCDLRLLMSNLNSYIKLDIQSGNRGRRQKRRSHQDGWD